LSFNRDIFKYAELVLHFRRSCQILDFPLNVLSPREILKFLLYFILKRQIRQKRVNTANNSLHFSTCYIPRQLYSQPNLTCTLMSYWVVNKHYLSLSFSAMFKPTQRFYNVFFNNIQTNNTSPPPHPTPQGCMS